MTDSPHNPEDDPQVPPMPPAEGSPTSMEPVGAPQSTPEQYVNAPNYQAPGVPVYGAAYVNGPAYIAGPPQHQGNGLGLAALIIGILALIGAFIPFVNYLSGLLALVGVVLGAIALFRKGRPKGTAIAGTIVSVIAMVLSVILAFTYTAGFVSAVDDSLPKSQSKSQPDSDDSASEDNSNADADAEADAEEVGTRENPAPLGTTIELTSGGEVEYEVTLGESTLNANDLVAAANQFNEEPKSGFQYALVPVTVVYKGTETGSPWIDISVEFVSADGTTHTTGDALAVAPEPRFNDINDLYPDATGTGNVVIAIPTVNADNGTWAVSGLFSSDPYFYSAQ